MVDNLYKILGFWWTIPKVLYGNKGLHGPFCPKCYSDLDIPYNNPRLLICTSCKQKIELEIRVETLQIEAYKKYKASIRSVMQKISLDEPPTDIRVKDQDEKYFLAAKIGQKDGKRIGVVYFGEKVKEQSKEDYSQIFIDLDDEQIRFDKSNKHPKDVVAEFKVEFPSSTAKLVSKKN